MTHEHHEEHDQNHDQNKGGGDVTRPLTPGQMLKSARTRRGMPLHAAAERLRLSASMIVAMESDDYAFFSAEIYLKGHLRSYAKLLALNPEEVFVAYGAVVGDAFEHAAQTPDPKLIINSARSRRRFLGYFGIGIGVLMAVLVAVWWSGQHHVSDESAVQHTIPKEVIKK